MLVESLSLASKALYLAAVLVVLGGLSAWAVASALPARLMATNAAPADGGLSDDDAGAGLFELGDLAPGQAESRCIAVRHDGQGPADVRLSGSVDDSGLADLLRLRVEAGSGGRFGDCSGFAGATIFDGSLAEFMSRHGDYASGLPAFAAADGGTTATFRVAVALADVATAQGATATAGFTWEARAGEPATVLPSPPDHGNAPPPGPRRAPPRDPGNTAPPPDPGSPSSPSPEIAPSNTPAAAPGSSTLPGRARRAAPPTGSTGARERSRRGSGRRPSRARDARGDAGPSKRGRDTPRARRRADEGGPGLLDAVAKLIAPVAERAIFPLALLVIAGLFLLIQDRIDRRDPKLARAPLRADPDLPFPPPPLPGGNRL